jgi:hypothetical protein
MMRSKDGKILFSSHNYLTDCSKLVMEKTDFEYNDPPAFNYNHWTAMPCLEYVNPQDNLNWQLFRE